MTGPDTPSWPGADDAPTLPGFGPVPPVPPGPYPQPPVTPGPDLEPPTLLGLNTVPPGPTPPSPPGGAHRRGAHPAAQPWPWLVGVAALAVVGALGLAMTIGGTVDRPRRPPAAVPAETLPLAVSTPPGTDELLPTSTGSPAASPSSPPVTASPTPSPTATRSPTPSPQPRIARVPDVVGDRLPAAEATVRAAGFAVTVVRVPAPSRRQAGRVVAQLPRAGQLAPAGSTVTLLVGDR